MLESPLPAVEGEYWLKLDELITDADFQQMEVLVDGNGGILGARAKFRGSAEEWADTRGKQARTRVLRSSWEEMNSPTSCRQHTDGSGFGDMLYTFDLSGNVSSRKAQGVEVMREPDYIRKFEAHVRGCDECKNASPLPNVVLTRPEAPAKESR